MRSLLLPLLLTVAVALPVAADDEALARRLVGEFFGAAMANDESAIRAMVAEGFQAVDRSGALGREDAIERVLSRDIQSAPNLSDFEVTRQEALLVVTYKARVSQVIDGKRTDRAPAQRLTVFMKTDKGWEVISHANFKSP